MTLEAIAGQFSLEGTVLSIKPLGEGFINDTFTIKTGEGSPDYLLQRKNHLVFPDVPAMMDNIVAVTEHIKKKVADPMRETLTVVDTKDGKHYYKDEDGNYWAVCVFIEGTMSYFTADSPALAREGGIGIGRFQSLLSDFKTPLAEVIKGFHNMRWRFVQWDEALKADKAGRAASLATEIGWIESRREEMMKFQSLVEDGTIPTRVSHNDTKISNILFNASDRSVLCAIDLDTVMSSTVLNDVGDALRSYTNTAAEDEPDLSKVSMSMDMFKAYIEGYLSEAGSFLTPIEKEYLAFSGIFITFEQVLRFLMDYIDGDTYYKIKYPEHNLVRTHSQYSLLESMEAQYEEMKAFVKQF
ncbi:MAG: aminoglycoside phosphotransferase family protein [Bacteroidales bacterium]|nr:aminoglycoside phosphotransferase family protein [Bacteroidales bacterium]